MRRFFFYLSLFFLRRHYSITWRCFVYLNESDGGPVGCDDGEGVGRWVEWPGRGWWLRRKKNSISAESSILRGRKHAGEITAARRAHDVHPTVIGPSLHNRSTTWLGGLQTRREGANRKGRNKEKKRNGSFHFFSVSVEVPQSDVCSPLTITYRLHLKLAHNDITQNMIVSILFPISDYEQLSK